MTDIVSTSTHISDATSTQQEAHAKEDVPVGENIAILLFILTTITWFIHSLGVWEPWEAHIAEILDYMRQNHTWLQVNLLEGGTQVSKAKYVPQLPFGYWGTLCTYSLFPSALGLRLAHALLACAVSFSLFRVCFRLWGRHIAYVALGLWLSFPVVSLSSHFVIYDMGAWYWSCWSCLAYLSIRSYDDRPWKIYMAWFLWLVSCCTGGLIAGIVPLLILFYPHHLLSSTNPSQTETVHNKNSSPYLIQFKHYIKVCQQHALPMLCAITLLALAMWRVQVKAPEHILWSDLWLNHQPLTQSFTLKDYQGFQQTLHMLGFALFPLSALVPMVLVYIFQQAHHSDHPQDHILPTRNTSALPTHHFLTTQHLYILLIIWFSLAFLLPAIQVGHGSSMMPLLALPLAMAGAIYLVRLPYLPAQNLWFVITLLFLVLLDSNLKKNPQLLIETLLAHPIEDAKGWPILWGKARLLTLAFITFLMMYQSSVLRRITALVQQMWTQPKPARYSNIYLILLGVVVALAVWIPQASPAIRDWQLTRTFMSLPLWGRVALWVRLLIWVLFVSLSVVTFIWTLWAYHFQRKQKATQTQSDTEKTKWVISLSLGFFVSLFLVIPHYLPSLPAWVFIRPLVTAATQILTPYPILAVVGLHVILWGLLSIFFHLRASKSSPQQFIDHVMEQLIASIKWILTPSRAWWFMIILLMGFTGLQHHVMTGKFTQQLSQKALIEKFESLKQAQEPLSLYQLNTLQHAFYLKDKPKLNHQSFNEAMQSDERHFVLIDRKRLSNINHQFRKLTKKNLPVLDDSSHKFLLVSNQIKEHENDLNPIKKALIEKLPPNVHKLSEAINFEDRIELVAWATDPVYPRPGATLKLKLYWRCKKRSYGAWKIFVHIDAQGQRIHADHEPVEGLFPTKDWNEGDLIQDIYTIKVKSSIKPADFIFYAGLYQGKRRMKIQNASSKLKDKENRAILGKIKVRSR